MTLDVEFVSAKIIPFPAPAGRRKLPAGKPGEERLAHLAAAALDTCWYHDEAVREDSSTPGRTDERQ